MSSLMRAALIPALGLPFLLASCGHSSDLLAGVDAAQSASKVAGEPAAELLTAIPERRGGYDHYWTIRTLWRTRNNTIRLVFDSPIELPGPGELMIQELLPDGAFGPDLNDGAAFSLSLEQDATVLRIRENGSHLTNRRWYALRATDWPGVNSLEVHVLVLRGDTGGNGFVSGADYVSINGLPPGRVSDQDRHDVNGDGFRTNADVLISQSYVSSPSPPKPSGH